MATSTGRGDWPFISTWRTVPWNRQTAAADGPDQAIWSDWRFNAPAGGVTLTAALGAVLLTGTGATLTAGRLLAGSAGSSTQTGTPTTLTVGRVVGAEGGTYTFTGMTTTLGRGYVLESVGSTYALSGQTATLSAARLLLGTGGASTWTGQAASLVYTPLGGGYTGSSDDVSALIVGWLQTLSEPDKSTAWAQQIPTIRAAPQALAEDLNTDTKTFLDDE